MTVARDALGPGVRPATADDLPELDRLAGLAFDHLAEQRGGAVYRVREARTRPVTDSLSEDLDLAASSPARRVVLLGTIGDVPVGFATAHVASTSGDPMAVVGELYVEPEARRVGLGHLLMRSLVEWATARGCAGIDAEVLPGDRDTKNFFEGLGLVARKITVHRSLPEGDDGG
jgi:GNAT superfamily N-acetyltransferase